jgi:hypothetical protein
MERNLFHKVYHALTHKRVSGYICHYYLFYFEGGYGITVNPAVYRLSTITCLKSVIVTYSPKRQGQVLLRDFLYYSASKSSFFSAACRFCSSFRISSAHRLCS